MQMKLLDHSSIICFSLTVLLFLFVCFLFVCLFVGHYYEAFLFFIYFERW